ncbi:MAG: exodeoxyribonuclease VII large subunit, partial [Candidatus Fischerbacteria bacterium RBG_13_37_8]
MNNDWETPFFQEPFSLEEGKTNHKIYTISELTAELRVMLEDSYPLLWVEGELSNCKLHQNKHLFFTMKDENSQIDAIMFSSNLQQLTFHPENGLQVIVQGRISFYSPQGKTQIIVHDMQLKGKGALFIALHQLKIKLQKEGLFDSSHKKALPLLPQKIGIITSSTGAAIRDILKVIGQRHPNLEIQIYPSRVQGDEAPGELIEGVEYFNKAKTVDVIILTRGGGSIEDLWA